MLPYNFSILFGLAYISVSLIYSLRFSKFWLLFTLSSSTYLYTALQQISHINFLDEISTKRTSYSSRTYHLARCKYQRCSFCFSYSHNNCCKTLQGNNELTKCSNGKKVFLHNKVMQKSLKNVYYLVKH